MSKNINNSFSKTENDLISKYEKIYPSNKLSDIFINNNDPSFSQNQYRNIFNTLSNFYIKKKEEKNSKINNFLEKINQLNKQFYANNEKAMLTKSSYEKINQDLFVNLFKQIDCYVEEIQRLNKKIISTKNKNDLKEIIKKLNKEISEKKEKIRNYELKIKEKTLKEEKLNKEIEYYKKRVTFFKNKININLISRNINRGNSKMNLPIINEEKNNIFPNKKYKSCKSSNNYTIKDMKINNFLSPSPGKQLKKKNYLCFMNPINRTTYLERKQNIKAKLFNSNMDITSNNDKSNRDLITVNVDKFLKLHTDKEFESNSSGNILKITKNYSKENFFSTSKINNMSIINKNNINKKKINDVFFDLNKDVNSCKKSIEENTNLYNDNKSNSELINSNNFNSLNSTIKFNKKSQIISNLFKENGNNNLNYKDKNLLKASSSRELSIYKANTFNNNNNHYYKKKHSKSKTMAIYKENKSLNIFKNIINEKLNGKRKINSLNPQYSSYTNSYYKEINNNRYNEINGSDIYNINNNNKSSLDNYTQEEIPFKRNNYLKIKNDNESNKMKINISEKNKHNKIKDYLLNSENLNKYDNNNVCLSNQIRKIESKFKSSNSNLSNFQNRNQTTINVNKKIMEKEGNGNMTINDKNQISKILKGINDDYESNIEMLNYQENEIKHLLNLIDLKED